MCESEVIVLNLNNSFENETNRPHAVETTVISYSDISEESRNLHQNTVVNYGK